MNFNFTNKTVIVTGAAHGFGRAITLAFAKLGAAVWGCDILSDELAETKGLCAGLAGSCEVRTVDVRDKTAVFAFVSEIPTPINILVNNAGGVGTREADHLPGPLRVFEKTMSAAATRTPFNVQRTAAHSS